MFSAVQMWSGVVKFGPLRTKIIYVSNKYKHFTLNVTRGKLWQNIVTQQALKSKVWKAYIIPPEMSTTSFIHFVR